MIKKPSAKKDSDKETVLSVRGMRDLVDNEVYRFQGFFEKAAEVAIYYGFKPLETPILEKEELFIRGVGQGTDIVEKEMYTLKTRGGDRLALRSEGTAPAMRAYLEDGLQAWPQPVMLYYHGPFFRHDNPQRGRWRQFYQFGAEVLGTSKSIADALVIKVASVILEEAGLKNMQVEINSIGDKECRHVYRRELTNYYRKHLKTICADCRERLKFNPLRVLDCKNPKCQEIKKGAPESISYLCHDCKQHFKEVLEHLGTMGITYVTKSTLVRGLDYYSRTVFEIIELPPETAPVASVEETLPLAVAGGGRYDYLAKMLGHKKDLPAVGFSIGVDRVLLSPNAANLLPRIIKKPKVFFIQLGFDAKLKSFEVIEILRHARIPLAQSLPKDSLGSQLALAEKMRVPYTIILGQKEAIDNTVIVRDMTSRSQDTVKIKELSDYLKKIFAK